MANANGKLIAFVFIGLAALWAYDSGYFRQISQNGSAANSSAATVVVTPKFIQDFNNPRPSIRNLLDQYRTTLSSQPTKIVVFAVGSGDHIYSFPSQIDHSKFVVFEDDAVTFDAHNDAAGWEDKAKAELDTSVKYSGSSSYRVSDGTAGRRMVVKTGLHISLSQFPVVSWAWRKQGGSRIIMQFHVAGGDWIGYVAGPEVIKGFGPWDDYVVSNSMPSDWQTVEVNLYDDYWFMINGPNWFMAKGSWTVVNPSAHAFESQDLIVDGIALTPYDGVGWFDKIEFSDDGAVFWSKESFSSVTMNQAGRVFPQVLRYSQIRDIVSVFKQEALLRGWSVKVLDMVDAGDEFTAQPWKFRRHPEALYHSSYMNLNVELALHAEDFAYASYPNGIPEGLLCGTFLAKQIGSYVNSMGFDGIYLCNSFGLNGLWFPIGNNVQYSSLSEQRKLSFFQTLRQELKGKTIIWMDSYYPVRVEHDYWSMPYEAYQLFDYIEISTFWDGIIGGGEEADYGATMEETIQSKIALKQTYPSIRLLYTFYFTDPWYQYTELNSQAYTRWEKYKANLDGAMYWIQGCDGSLYSI